MIGCIARFDLGLTSGRVSNFEASEIFDTDQRRHRFAAAQHEQPFFAIYNASDIFRQLRFHDTGIHGEGHSKRLLVILTN